MKNSILPKQRSTVGAFTLIEVLVAVSIIAILAALSVSGYQRAFTLAEATKSVNGVKQIVNATLVWTADHGGRLPSPEYPGGMTVPNGVDPNDFWPDHWNDVPDSGLWLDGVIFAEVYKRGQEERLEDDSGRPTSVGYEMDMDGTHLKGTLFECVQSIKQFPEEKNWHWHSYAMNKNIQYDRIYDTAASDDPWLTEKTLSNIPFASNAMLYVECMEKNVVEFQDLDLILETAEGRWDGKKVIVGYLGGNVERIRPSAIPTESPENDRDSSRFWRGVDP